MLEGPLSIGFFWLLLNLKRQYIIQVGSSKVTSKNWNFCLQFLRRPKMVGLLASSKTPCPSFPFLESLLPYKQINSRFSISIYSTTFHHKECFSFLNNKAPKFPSKPISRQACFQSGERVLIKCSCVNSSLSSKTEMGMLFSFFGELGLNGAEIEVLLDKNSALMSASLDLVRARILFFQSVGIDGFPLCLLITKRPNVLTAEEVDHFISFVVDDLEGKIEASQLERVFTTVEPRFLAGFDQKVKLLLERGVPEEKIVHILNTVNLSKALCTRPAEEIDRTITFLSRFGGIDLIVKRPKLLNYDLESQLIPRVGFLMKLGRGDEDAIGTVLTKLPAVLNYSAEHMKNHAEFLRSFAGLNDEEIFKVVVAYPNVFSASRDRKLYPRIQFLKECGLDSEDLFRFLTKAPLFLGHSFDDNIAHKLVYLIKIGYRYRTKDLAVAMGSVTRTSCQNMQKVLGLFLSYGFSYEDLLAMSKKHPQILQYNCVSLEKKMEYLIGEMGREIEELLAFPAFLGYKLDDRIKARYESRRKILGGGMSLNKLLTVSSERFSQRRETPVHVIEE